MCNNLIFYNLPEEENDEKSAKWLVSEVIEKIGLNPEEIEIERAHRIGKRKSDANRPRPIVI